MRNTIGWSPLSCGATRRPLRWKCARTLPQSKSPTSAMSKARNPAHPLRALHIASLSSAYRGGLDPASVIRDLLGRIRDDRTQDVWIAVVALETALARLDDLGRR